MTDTTNSPSIGAGILLSNGPRGWQPGALLFPQPLLILRSRAGRVTLQEPKSQTSFFESDEPVLTVLDRVLTSIHKHLPAAGPGAGKPTFPVALITASYEFGAQFSPHENCFHSTENEEDFIASIFIDAYRPDSRGGTERIGYAGVIPEGWIEGAPSLRNEPWGHDAPPIIPHTTASTNPRAMEALVSEQEFTAKIAQIQEYLRAGDIYQANLTIPLAAGTARTPEQIFDTAIKRGGAAFAGMMVLPERTLLSLSPELLLRRRDEDVETRPIKGTRPVPRHMTGILEAREELAASEKDRAEHLMIVDLERNDLGKLCESGSIDVFPFMEVVEHPTVLHMESTVKGKLRKGVTIPDLFAAVYPGGSVTGAPKKRAMEIIRELEATPRGPYCGAFGWIDAAGDCELNLPIRTALLSPDGSVLYNAGCGIVADSDPAEEWRELQTKVEFFRSLLEQ